jgi:hypothetical protein
MASLQEAACTCGCEAANQQQQQQQQQQHHHLQHQQPSFVSSTLPKPLKGILVSIL